MSHPEQIGFFNTVVEANKPRRERKRAGNWVIRVQRQRAKGIRSGGRYVGVDLVADPGVDLVGSLPSELELLRLLNEDA